MKNLQEKDTLTTVNQRLRRAAIRLTADDDEATPQTAAIGQQLEATRQGLRAQTDTWEVAVILVAIWVQRVQQRDKSVNTATAELVKALNAHTDEPAVAAVLPLAVPSSASEATRGVADERQHRYVRNLISQVKNAADMPAKVRQRLAALETAQGKLEAAMLGRQGAEDAERAERVKLDLVAAAAKETFNAAYFTVGGLFPKNKKRVEAYFG